MHKALTLSEILNLIFAFLPRSANATNARVCKTWSDSALDDVWYEIPDVSKAFQALAATVVSNGKLDYTRPPTLSEWNAFLVNCDRVRILDCNVADSPNPLSSDAIHKIAVTRPTGCIFKGVRKLRSKNIVGGLDPMFMSSSVTDLSLSITDNTTSRRLEQLSWDIDAIIARMPHVVSLSLEKSTIGPEVLEPFLLQFIEGYPSLTEFHVPYKCLRTRIVEVASRLPNLCVLRNDPGWDTIYASTSMPAFEPKLNAESFPVLNDFDLTATTADAVQLVRDPHFPSHNLRALCLRVIIDIREGSSNGISRLLDAISDTCISITDLSLYLQSTFVGGQQRLSITFEDIVPVFGLSSLQTLELYNDEPIKMTDDDAQSLASSLPELVTLYLTRHASQPPPLTLRCLSYFARHCLKLSTLEIVLNSNDCVPLASDATPFRSLRFLHLGASPISDVQPVVQFLAPTLPVKCRLLVMNDAVVNQSAVYRSPASNGMDRSWKEVQDSLLRISESKEVWADNERSLLNEITKLNAENQALKTKLELSKPKAEKN
ncbi:uncharacterized protein STEHIDRAFT_172087 [Stereum hirsutum FP-91666 SS1]|uniref:uncharacterized protein n=1 Tax=Stereum hirsutum (strain FP-91666) TaxID=721885 RepID=UPI00044495B6|nr:uncharacterized protein STEHIDRAFT_172087 [Stereum hirsutum FP-91666 SS1]EIM81036.1 hypothetical protein STEHIDRAFT_172087 [Stereum hirsutum FP-91666 SS1]